MSNAPRFVRDVMTHDVVTLECNERLVIADDLMRLGRIRHLPVVDSSGELVGIVSQRDLFHSGLMRALGYGSHAQRQTLDAIVVKEAMHTNIFTISEGALLSDAARIMLDNKVGCLVVVDGKKIVGILTESDFVKLAVSS